MNFEIVATDPDGDLIARYFYQLDGQTAYKSATWPEVSMGNLKAGSRTLIIYVEDARGSRSAPVTARFTVGR